MMRSLKQLFDAAISLAPAARTATANGTGVDLQGFGAATLLVIAGTWTDGSHVITLEESDDNTTFTSVAAGNIDGALPTISSAPTASQVYRIGYRGLKRYVRAVVTASGTTTGAVYGAVFLLQDPKKAPK